MQIFVKVFLGGTFTIDVKPSDTIKDIKPKIQDVEYLSPERKILFRGEVLYDNSTLKSYNIQDGDTIHISPQPTKFTAKNSYSYSNFVAVKNNCYKYYDKNGSDLNGLTVGFTVRSKDTDSEDSSSEDSE